MWVAETDPADREHLRDVLLSEPITDYLSLISFSQRVMAEVLCGNIPPEVGAQAKQWGEMIFASLAAERANMTGSSLLDALAETPKTKQIAPVWTEADLTEADGGQQEHRFTLRQEVIVDENGVMIDVDEEIEAAARRAQAG